MKREVVITSDGSNSLYIKEMDEQYHSKHGAIAEAKKVFIEYGLDFLGSKKEAIKVFEVGFGTGLNALLSLIYSLKNKLRVDYHTIEKYPLNIEEIGTLNYVDNLKTEASYFNFLHESDWEELISFNENFRIKKIKADLKSLEQKEKYDLIYFDAFAPEKQSNMWTLAIFKKMYDSLELGGILTTYCVKGEVRRSLMSIGFKVEKLKGPEGGKREVLRATKV